MVLILFFAYGVRTSYVQTWLAQRATSYLSSELDVDIHIGKVTIQSLKDLKLEDVFFEDHHGDTLLSAKELYLEVRDYDLKKKTIDANNITFNQALFFLKKYEGEEQLNLQFLIDYFTSDEETSDDPFLVNIDQIRIFDSEFRYEDFNRKRKPRGVDFSHLRLRGLNAEFSKLEQTANFITTNIQKLSFQDQSGFKLNSLTSNARYSNNQIMLDDLSLVTDKTNFKTKHFSFDYRKIQDFGSFLDKVKMNAEIKPSVIHSDDLAYFVDQFHGFNESIDLSGVVDGTVSDLNIRDLDLKFGELTEVKGDVAMKGLPDIQTTWFDANFSLIKTDMVDVRKITSSPLFGDEELALDQRIVDVDHIAGIAQFTGTIHDFESYANLSSGMGGITGNLAMRYDSLRNKYQYNGLITTNNLDVGRLAAVNDLGKISTTLTINSTSENPLDFAALSSEIHATFNAFEFMGYTYKNIRVDGNFANNRFKGKVKVNDKNLVLNFDGMVDFSKKLPVYDFTAEILAAHLYELNLDRSEESQMICTTILVDGQGSNADNFGGIIQAKELTYHLKGTDYVFDLIEVISTLDSTNHELAVYSDVVDMSIGGSFSIQEIPDAFYALAGSILPSVFPPNDKVLLEEEDFNFKVNVKDLSLITQLFLPELQVAPKTQLNGEYESSHQDLTFNLNSDWLRYKHYQVRGMHLRSDRYFDVYVIDFLADSLYLGDSIHLDHFEFATEIFDDNIDAQIHWKADDISNSGEITGVGYWTARDRFHFELDSSWVVIGDDAWEITEAAEINQDSTQIHISRLHIQNGDQLVDINGYISEDSTKSLEYTISQLELANFSGLVGNDFLGIKGVLTANGNLRDFYNHPIYDLEFDVNACSLHGELLGDVWGKIEPHWGNVVQQDGEEIRLQRRKITALDIEGNIVRDGRYQFDFLGRYYVDGREDPMAFNFNLDDMDMKVANGFLPDGLSDIKGGMNGSVSMSGSPDEILFDGFIVFTDAGAHIDLLNTDYTLSGKVAIKPDGFYMSQIPIKDSRGHTATLYDGSFYHLNFKDYSYNFQLGMREPFMVMNTTKELNSLYYGDAFITGDIAISYDKYNELELYVTAKSEKGTNLVLPLDGAEEVVLPEFITFTDRSDPQEEKVGRALDLSGIKMNFDLEVTQDAQISIVFDEVVGDVMTGNGNGDIHMEIDEFEQFVMYGYYEVNEGNYLFTMFDFINKPFSVRKGGTISWYGDPYNADINLQAVYETKASLYDIMPAGEKEEYRGNTEVHCIMNLKDNLFNPELSFDIELPRSDENAKSVLANTISSTEELNKQVFSLMVLNKFLPRTNAISGASGSAFGAGVGATTSDLLSSQLGSWLDGLSDQIEIGVNAKFGDEVSEDEVAVAMSKTLFNDRLEISGNFGVANSAAATGGTQSSRLIGDVDVEYKLNEQGNFRVHAFNESNEYDPLQSTSYYTQGVGIFYKESFENWWELKHKVLNVFRKEEDEVHYYKAEEGEEPQRFD